MKWMTKKAGSKPTSSMHVRSRMFRSGLAALAAASLMMSAANARAACGNLAEFHGNSAIHLPMLAQADGEQAQTATAENIVGLWAVVYTAGGQVFNQTLDQWHSDGTEFENAFLSPEQGNICFGVWKAVGPRTVRLHHIGWTFDPATTGTANGTFTLDETNTVAPDGRTYSGTFTFKTYNLEGAIGANVSGTLLATRITVN